MEQTVDTGHNDLGVIKISEEVVSIIAGLAATEIKGVAGMSGGLVGGITEMLGRKNLSKGVKVSVGEKEAAVDLSIIVDYGVKIPDVAWQIQENVKKAIETMTGLKVTEVNIHIQDVYMGKEPKEDEQPQRAK